MSVRTITLCDGCSREIDTGKPYITIELNGVSFVAGTGLSMPQHIHSLTCMGRWQAKLTKELVKQLGD